MTLIDPSTLAQRLDIPLATLARWRHRNTGPTYLKIGRHVRYREEDVVSWMRRQAVPTDVRTT